MKRVIYRCAFAVGLLLFMGVTISCDKDDAERYDLIMDIINPDNEEQGSAPIWKKCLICVGEKHCIKCHGTGISHDNPLGGAMCYTCKGTGRCPACNGMGGSWVFPDRQ